MPYQVLGVRDGALAVTISCRRFAMARSAGGIFAISSRSAFSPSVLSLSSLARALIAARSSAENVWPFEAFFALFFAVLVLAIAKHLLWIVSAAVGCERDCR